MLYLIGDAPVNSASARTTTRPANLYIRSLPLLAVLIATASVLSPAAHAHAASPDRAAYTPGRVIVGYRPAPNARSVVPHSRGWRRGPLPPSVPSSGEIRTVLERLPRGERVTAAVAALRRRPGVAYAYPDYVAHAAGSFVPDDPGVARRAQGWELMQWNMLPSDGVNAPQAWSNLIADHHPGGRGVVVAVLDTGVAYRNWRQFRESPDFHNTRFVAPYDFIANSRFPLDRLGHGTFVAGEIAESTNNKIGLTGLAYGASIMPVRVLDAQGEGDEATIARGIRYAVNHGAQVINLSLEFLTSQVNSASEIPLIASAISFAHRRGVIVVAAAGNDDTNQIAYPAREPGVISVSASTKDHCLADYSNAGTGLDLVAPGGGDDAIMPTDPDCHPERSLPSIYQLTLTDPPHWNRFGYPNYYIGTSMASPQVAATAALVIASRVIGPHPTPDQVLARLEQTATPLPAGATTRFNSNYGYGLLNAGAATTTAPKTPATTTSTTTSTTSTATSP
jgi:serine protease